MTTLSRQKTFYAKSFETALRSYFKCPSKTTTGNSVAYLFLQNKDNKTGFYRTKDKGLSDIVLRSYSNGSMAEEKYLTFFPYQDKISGGFTVGEEHWKNFVNATDYSGEKTIWGVFCVNKDKFMLAHNASCFNTHNITVYTEHYTFNAVEVKPQDFIVFERSDNKKDWIVSYKNSITLMPYDNQYKSILPDNAECYPLPRIGKEHLIVEDGNISMMTFTDVANKYHESLSVDAFISKLRRNLETNKKQVDKDLRMKPLKGTKVIVVPDDFTQQDFIEWQNNHKICNKTDVPMRDYMRDYRNNM